MLYDSYNTDQRRGHVFEIVDMLKLLYTGDENPKLFLHSRLQNLQSMRKPPGEELLEAHLYDQLSGSRALSSHVSHYERLPDGDPDRSYKYLMDRLVDFCDMKAKKEVRASIIEAQNGKGPKPTAALATDLAGDYNIVSTRAQRRAARESIGVEEVATPAIQSK